MKKTLFVLLLNLIGVTIFAQSKDLYIIFQERTGADNEIKHLTSPNFDSQRYRYQPHLFRVKQACVIRTFYFMNLTSESDIPILTKPVSFLETVEYMDWNSEIMNYSGAQFYEFLDKLRTYDKVYFIDRSEIKDGMMKMYPAKELRANY